MKKSVFLSSLFFLIGVTITFVLLVNPFHWEWVHILQDRSLSALNLRPAQVEPGEKLLWTCGMHPQVIQEESGTCPICGMSLVPRRGSASRPGSEGPAEERTIRYWQAPMDPTFISDKPGKSPMGMDLIPVYEEEEEPSPGTVKIDPVFVQNFGVQFIEVRRTDIPFTIRTVGTLTYNEEQISWVNTKYEGWIEKVYVNSVGEPVEKGQNLFEIYSPQLITTQKEYLQAMDYAERLGGSDYPEIVSRAQSLLESSRQRLHYWDVTEEQIRELQESRQLRRTLTIKSPASGLVVEKMDQALEGMHVEAGMNLYKIADLSTLWLEADVFENQIPWLKVGQEARVDFPHQPGRHHRGTVRYIYPFLNKNSRTLKVSIQLANPGQRLRADMYANVTFDVPAARGVLAVPEESVIHSGTRNIVVLDRGRGTFQVKEVLLGINGSGLWEVKEGLKEGDRAVVSSQFLIDSESNLREAIRKIVSDRNGNEEVPEPHQ